MEAPERDVRHGNGPFHPLALRVWRPRLENIARHLMEQQMSDGGWNCRRAQGATHASVHTTISALEGLGSTNGTRDWKCGKCGKSGTPRAAAGSSCWHTG